MSPTMTIMDTLTTSTGTIFVNRDGDPADDNFHGTHVAGIIGAVANNDLGVVGVSSSFRLMALETLDANVSGYVSDMVPAIDYAVANGPKIINASSGGIATLRHLMMRLARQTMRRCCS